MPWFTLIFSHRAMPVKMKMRFHDSVPVLAGSVEMGAGLLHFTGLQAIAEIHTDVHQYEFRTHAHGEHLVELSYAGRAGGNVTDSRDHVSACRLANEKPLGLHSDAGCETAVSDWLYLRNAPRLHTVEHVSEPESADQVSGADTLKNHKFACVDNGCHARSP
jgi:hypothetical protein